jgi:LysM repeat protein
MRHLPALAAAASVAVLFLAGCEERANMRELPDRQGHAYKTPAADRPLAAGPAVPYQDEQVYTLQKGDTLKSVARKFGVTEAWIIRRNDMDTHKLIEGANIIVPKQQAK